MSARRTPAERQRRLIGVCLGIVATVGWGPFTETVTLLASAFTWFQVNLVGVLLTVLVGVLSYARHGGQGAFTGPTRARAREGLLADVVVGAAISSFLVLTAYTRQWPYAREPLVSYLTLETIQTGYRGIMAGSAVGLFMARRRWLQSGNQWFFGLSLFSIMWMADFTLHQLKVHILVSAVIPIVLRSILLRRTAAVPRSVLVVTDQPDFLKLRLPGLNARRVFRFMQDIAVAGTMLGVGLGLLSTWKGIDFGQNAGLFAEVVFALGTVVASTGVFWALQAFIRLAVYRQRPLDLTLTPTYARVGDDRVEGRDLVLEVVQDRHGPLLVVGNSVVVDADVDPEALDSLLDKVRSSLVRESDDDARQAREALGSFATAAAKPGQVWLETGRRRAALANLVPPGVLAITFQPLLSIDATPAAVAMVTVPFAFFVLAAARVAFLARSARRPVPTPSAKSTHEADAESTHAQATARRRRQEQ